MISTRRQAILQGSLAFAGLGACKPGSSMRLGHLLTSTAQGDRFLLTQPIRVPGDFVGIHAHGWPSGKTPSPAPTYPFGAARSHDYGVAWNSIHRSPGVFDWTRLDEWVRVHSAAGRTLIYTFYGTPTWAAAIRDHADAYGAVGSAGPPADVSALKQFTRALVTRYNGGGKQRIHYLEIWNEPHFGGRQEQFWWGTAEQLVLMGRTIYTSARSIDPGVRILSPGFTGPLNGRLSLSNPQLADAQESSVYQYLTASDGSGGTGKKWCDGLAFHVYNSPLEGPSIGYLQEIQKLKAMLNLLGLSTLPIMDTEFGFLEPNPFHGKSLQDQASILRRCAAIQAALGVQGVYFYSHDDDLVGNPSIHPEIAGAIGDVHTMLSGKNLLQVTLLTDNTVKVATSEQTFIW